MMLVDPAPLDQNVREDRRSHGFEQKDFSLFTGLMMKSISGVQDFTDLAPDTKGRDVYLISGVKAVYSHEWREHRCFVRAIPNAPATEDVYIIETAQTSQKVDNIVPTCPCETFNTGKELVKCNNTNCKRIWYHKTRLNLQRIPKK